MNFFSWRIIGKRINAIRFMMADKTVPKRKKLLVVAGIVYLFLPFDIIPAVLFPIAWVDDLIVWIWIIWHLRDTLDTYWMGEKTVDPAVRYKGKRIIDGADFKVEDER